MVDVTLWLCCLLSETEMILCCWEFVSLGMVWGQPLVGKADCDNVYRKVCTWFLLKECFSHFTIALFFSDVLGKMRQMSHKEAFHWSHSECCRDRGGVTRVTSGS